MGRPRLKSNKKIDDIMNEEKQRIAEENNKRIKEYEKMLSKSNIAQEKKFFKDEFAEKVEGAVDAPKYITGRYVVGKKVFHQNYKKGKIIEVTGDVISVKFKGGEIKCFIYPKAVEMGHIKLVDDKIKRGCYRQRLFQSI